MYRRLFTSMNSRVWSPQDAQELQEQNRISIAQKDRNVTIIRRNIIFSPRLSALEVEYKRVELIMMAMTLHDGPFQRRSLNFVQMWIEKADRVKTSKSASTERI